MHWAAKQGNADVVHILIDAGANANSKSVSYSTFPSTIHKFPNVKSMLAYNALTVELPGLRW